MNVLKKNIVANFCGSLWAGLMSLVFIPLYIRFLGIEAYGLIGIFATLLALFSLLDMGLGNTLNREMAWLSVQENKAQEMRDLLRTLEIPYWAMAGLISITVAVLSPLITYHWVNAKNLSPVSIQRAIIIMGFATAFQWPLGFYSGGLMGLQRQVLLNGINAIMATCRGVGAVLILWLVSPTVEAFFTWQIIISLTHTGTVVFFLWRILPVCPEKPCFRRDLLINIWRFAAGMTGITILSTILTQLDKVILSRMLTLEMFGYYTLASVVALNLYRFIHPVFTATYPRLTNLLSIGDRNALINLYHKSAQLVSVLMLPVAAVVTFFSKELILLWTQDPTTADRTHLLVSVLVIGTAFNGVMNIPYALQLAAGWTKLTIYVNLVSVLLLVPLLIVLTKLYGAVGAACVWVILNCGYVLFAIQIMHRRLLQSEKWRWYRDDVGLPFVVAFGVAYTFRQLAPVPADMLYLSVYLTIAAGLTLGITTVATPVTRNWLRAQAAALKAN